MHKLEVERPGNRKLRTLPSFCANNIEHRLIDRGDTFDRVTKLLSAVKFRLHFVHKNIQIPFVKLSLLERLCRTSLKAPKAQRLDLKTPEGLDLKNQQTCSPRLKESGTLRVVTTEVMVVTNGGLLLLQKRW